VNPLYQQLVSALTRYMSGVNAHTVVGRAVRAEGIDPTKFTHRDLDRILPMVEQGVRLFVDPARQSRLKSELDALSGRRAVSSHIVSIRTEQDISQARVMARTMCEGARAKSFVAQKVATVVSELARNIVSYTPGGSVELHLSNEGQPRMIIKASDTGMGISNLEEVLSGKYRSTTGLGRGLLGVKRLADKFDIKTGKGGTQVEAEVLL
jgi:serine/threonine-protein kinase RsbT